MQKKEKITSTATRKNMRGEDRRQLILEEAARFFAEIGFEGKTRELAKRMGITHAALYRHFESKDALIEAVYQRIYVNRWDVSWEELILDDTRPLRERLQQFYQEYIDRVFEYEWVRIFVYSGLTSYGMNERYLSLLRSKFIRPCAERLEIAEMTIEEKEDLVWGLHGSIFYIAIRKYVYEVEVNNSISTSVRNSVDLFFDGLSGKSKVSES